MGECTGEEVLGEVEVDEAATGGDFEREGVIDGVVEEGDGGEVGEAAEDGGGERASDVGVGEVEVGDGGVRWVAGDAGPGTRGDVTVIPGGEGGVRVVQRALELVEVEALLVERENGGKREVEAEEEEQTKKKKKNGHGGSASRRQS